MNLRLSLFPLLLAVAIATSAQSDFTPLEQQQISIETPGLFARSDAFTIDLAALSASDYSFPLPVGKAKMGKDYSVEIETSKGDAVKAMFAGTVRLSKHHPSFGHVIVVRHDNGLETVYANNAENLVKTGDRVKAGQTLAIVGSEKGRYFCLFAIMVNGNRINPEIIFSLTSHRLRQNAILCKKTATWKVEVSTLREPRIADEPNTTETAADRWWCYPLVGAKVISPYGRRSGRSHTGVDLKTVARDTIRAAFAGTVVWSKPMSGYGNLVRITHANGLETYYSHNTKNLVREGDRVRVGQPIALTGQTGRASTPHLHFEVRINGRHLNPATFFNHQTYTIRPDAFLKTKDGYQAKQATKR